MISTARFSASRSLLSNHRSLSPRLKCASSFRKTFKVENFCHDRLRREISNTSPTPTMETKILPVDIRKTGRFTAVPIEGDILEELKIELDPEQDQGARNLALAAEALKHSDVPVAFPTETVYGLGADATRSSAVQGIYKAKQRPADNPLIVHFASLKQLRGLLRPRQLNGATSNGIDRDPIPAIYRPLIKKFWPGPLTLILPNPPNSPLATEVTAGLDTFGARMPRHPLALALIELADKPIAAPSANASTKPSPTAAEHVAFDLDGRIDMILDGGPCDVGVESTVVTGLCDPPLILRPGGISIEQVRSCAGWERTEIGYKNVAETDSRPSAPGMKYRHYSPKATVVLFEAGKAPPNMVEVRHAVGPSGKLGVVTTGRWRVSEKIVEQPIFQSTPPPPKSAKRTAKASSAPGFAGMIETLQSSLDARSALKLHNVHGQDGSDSSRFQILEIALGSDVADIARGIFSSLRELDRLDVDTIFVEGIDDADVDTAAAVMNRLRKAAEMRIAD